ncbi:unnamed protein product [Schistosoma bovis]|nr:unnamed protein product [Schistosoma bovis]
MTLQEVKDFRLSDSKITNASSEFYIPTQYSVKYRLCAFNDLKPSSYSKTFGFSNSMNALANNFELLKYHTKRVCKPLHCWVPQEFTSSWEDYAENICWVQNTYFLLPNEAIPEDDFEMLRVRHISYYQWVAIILAGQAMMAWVPHVLWRVWSKRVPVLLKNAREAAVPDKEVRHKAISCLVAALEEISEASKRYRRTRGIFQRCLGGPPPTTRITLLFLIVRIFFIANNIGQIYVMKHFIGTNDTLFGLHVFQELLIGSEWEVSGLFPRVTYCDVKVRKLGQLKPASLSVVTRTYEIK